MTSKSIAIACDHGGFDLKSLLQNTLEKQGYEVLDLGTNGSDSVDYPDFGYELARAIRDEKVSRGVLVCGSGIGISIAANRYTEVRAALIHDALGAKLSRQHNDANVICLGGRMIGPELALDCLNVFLTTDFEGGRHARRVEKLSNPT
jgi:ribose 5-phosphate isomerase B